MKTCSQCGQTKPLGEFHRRSEVADGHKSRCKICTNKRGHKYRVAHRGRLVIYERMRSKRPEHKAQKARQRKRYRQLYPEKCKAIAIVGYAIYSGRLKRMPCEKCGAEPSQGHHDDYAKPLDVRWLCCECHRKEHGQLQGG